jgi:hypothetical protein
MAISKRSGFTFTKISRDDLALAINGIVDSTQRPVNCVVYQMSPTDKVPDKTYSCQITMAKVTPNLPDARGDALVLRGSMMDENGSMKSMELVLWGKTWLVDNGNVYAVPTTVCSASHVIFNWL